jgi:hypothetical protein
MDDASDANGLVTRRGPTKKKHPNMATAAAHINEQDTHLESEHDT